MSTTLEQLGSYLGTKFDDLYKGNTTVGNSALINGKSDADIQTSTLTAIRAGVSTDGDTLLKLRNLISGLQSLINGDDVNLDSIKEISDYIKNNKDLIDSITTDKANTSDVYTKTEIDTTLLDKVNVSDVDGTISAANKVVTKSVVDSAISTAISGKANSSTTLAGYGITDAYTSSQVDTLITNTQSSLSTSYVTSATGDYSASAGEYIFAEISAGLTDITLPSAPDAGDTIYVLDTESSFDTTNLTLNNNGNTIMGVAGTYLLTTPGKETKIIYTGSTWFVI